jgi:branched-chain amino acid transport system permease protein
LLLQQIVSGITSGSIYALIALGFVAIYKATDILNFAQGEFVMIGAYFWLLVYNTFHLPYPLVFLISFCMAGVLGMVIERTVSRPLLNAPHMSVVFATVAVGIILRGMVRWIWGPFYYPFPKMLSNRPYEIAGVLVTPQNLWIILIVLSLMLTFYLFFKFTKMGKAMRATAQNRNAASLMGIRIKTVFSMTWAISAIMGAIAGCLLAPLVTANPDMGWVIIKAFAASIIGGFGSIPGAIVGGFLLGIIENIAGGFISTAFKDVASFLLIIVILVVMPSGLLGGISKKRV